MRIRCSFARGTVAGGITYLTAKAPIEKLASVVANPAGKATIAAVLHSQGLSEMGEEIAEYCLNYMSDLAFNDPEAEFSIEKLAMNAVAGYVGGVVFAGMGNAAGTAINYFKNKGTMSQASAEALVKAVDNMTEAEQTERLQSAGAENVDEVKQIILALPGKGETTRPTLYYDAEKGLVSDISRADEIEYFYSTHTLDKAPSNQNLINDVLVLADRTVKSAVDIVENNNSILQSTAKNAERTELEKAVKQAAGIDTRTEVEKTVQEQQERVETVAQLVKDKIAPAEELDKALNSANEKIAETENRQANLDYQKLDAQSGAVRAEAINSGKGKTVENIERYAAKRGFKVKYYSADADSVGNGFINGDTIYINVQDNNVMYKTAIHETIHGLKPLHLFHNLVYLS